MRIFLTILLGTIACVAFAQDRLRDGVHPDSQEWAEGSVMLKDGTELKGVVRYNNKTGVLDFRNVDVSKVLTARGAVAFEFYDSEVEKQRIFYSFEQEEEDTGLRDYFFFEVLKEFREFAVLSKVKPLEVRQKSNGGSMNPVTGYAGPLYTSTEYSQTEIIYFMDKKGNLEEYLEVREKETDATWFDSSRTKGSVKDEVFQKFTGSRWPKIEAYAKENSLKFKRKKDFLQILEYYASLIGD